MKIKSKAEMVSALMFYLHVLVYIDFLMILVMFEAQLNLFLGL